MLLGKMLQKIAPRIGAKVIIEPEWNIVGQITFKSGKRSYFRYNTLDLNPMGGSEIAKDKDFSQFFMKKMGYSTVPGSKTFFSAEWGETIGAKHRDINAGYKHADKLGFPVIVKPNSGSQGVGVSLVHNKKEFFKSAKGIFRRDRIMIVQQPVKGKDYRIVVLDKKIISVYERIPLNVIGDGKMTIKKLLILKQKKFVISKRDTNIRMDDPRIKMKLKHQKMDFNSVPKKGERIFLLDNANLSTGGDSMDVTNNIHPLFKKLAINLTYDMGLRLCGVDLMINGDIKDEPKEYYILEINSAPGLDHYVQMGKAQDRIVESLYLEVLKHIEK